MLKTEAEINAFVNGIVEPAFRVLGWFVSRAGSPRVHVTANLRLAGPLEREERTPEHGWKFKRATVAAEAAAGPTDWLGAGGLECHKQAALIDADRKRMVPVLQRELNTWRSTVHHKRAEMQAGAAARKGRGPSMAPPGARAGMGGTRSMPSEPRARSRTPPRSGRGEVAPRHERSASSGSELSGTAHGYQAPRGGYEKGKPESRTSRNRPYDGEEDEAEGRAGAVAAAAGPATMTTEMARTRQVVLESEAHVTVLCLSTEPGNPYRALLKMYKGPDGAPAEAVTLRMSKAAEGPVKPQGVAYLHTLAEQLMRHVSPLSAEVQAREAQRAYYAEQSIQEPDRALDVLLLSLECAATIPLERELKRHTTEGLANAGVQRPVSNFHPEREFLGNAERVGTTGGRRAGTGRVVARVGSVDHGATGRHVVGAASRFRGRSAAAAGLHQGWPERGPATDAGG